MWAMHLLICCLLRTLFRSTRYFGWSVSGKWLLFYVKKEAYLADEVPKSNFYSFPYLFRNLMERSGRSSIARKLLPWHMPEFKARQLLSATSRTLAWWMKISDVVQFTSIQRAQRLVIRYHSLVRRKVYSVKILSSSIWPIEYQIKLVLLKFL